MHANNVKKTIENVANSANSSSHPGMRRHLKKHDSRISSNHQPHQHPALYDQFGWGSDFDDEEDDDEGDDKDDEDEDDDEEDEIHGNEDDDTSNRSTLSISDCQTGVNTMIAQQSCKVCSTVHNQTIPTTNFSNHNLYFFVFYLCLTFLLFVFVFFFFFVFVFFLFHFCCFLPTELNLFTLSEFEYIIDSIEFT